MNALQAKPIVDRIRDVYSAHPVSKALLEEAASALLPYDVLRTRAVVKQMFLKRERFSLPWLLDALEQDRLASGRHPPRKNEFSGPVDHEAIRRSAEAVNAELARADERIADLTDDQLDALKAVVLENIDDWARGVWARKDPRKSGPLKQMIGKYLADGGSIPDAAPPDEPAAPSAPDNTATPNVTETDADGGPGQPATGMLRLAGHGGDRADLPTPEQAERTLRWSQTIARRNRNRTNAMALAPALGNAVAEARRA